jgi:hypothetical protein
MANCPYSTPTDTSKQIALARLFAYFLLEKTPVCMHVTGWSVWQSSELLDLFYRYRSSFGETRPLIEAPTHIFDKSDSDALVGILSMVLLFRWDAWVFDLGERWLVRTSHDEWLEVRTAERDDAVTLVGELEKYQIPLLFAPKTPEPAA